MTRTCSRPTRSISRARLSAANRTSPACSGRVEIEGMRSSDLQFLKEASLLAAGKIERGGHEMYPKPEELLHA